MCACVRVCAHVCMPACMCLCVYVCVCVHTRVCKSVFMHVLVSFIVLSVCLLSPFSLLALSDTGSYSTADLYHLWLHLEEQGKQFVAAVISLHFPDNSIPSLSIFFPQLIVVVVFSIIWKKIISMSDDIISVVDTSRHITTSQNSTDIGPEVNIDKAKLSLQQTW